jgi:hypothetical protein
MTINGVQSREDLAKLKEQLEVQDREIEPLRSILVSVINREKLEQLILENLKKAPEIVKVRFGDSPKLKLKQLSDKELLELYYQTLYLLYVQECAY